MAFFTLGKEKKKKKRHSKKRKNKTKHTEGYSDPGFMGVTGNIIHFPALNNVSKTRQ